MAILKAVLFDLDDTLVPEMEPEREAMLVVCGMAADKYDADPETMRVTVAEAAEKFWAQWRSPALYGSIAYSGWEGLWGPPDLQTMIWATTRRLSTSTSVMPRMK